MSMESDTVFHGVTQPNSEPEPKRLKSEPELGSEQEQKPKPPYYDFDPISIPDGNFTLSDFSVYDDDDDPYLYVGDEFVYKNKAWRKIEEEDALYRELSSKLSPYDAIPRPPNTQLLGGAPIVPIEVRECDRPSLTKLCQFALEDYNNKNQGASFMFDDLVKCTMGCEFYYDDDDDGIMYYITFQAKANRFDSPAITIFQAQVWNYEDDAKPPVVKECRIKF